MLFENLAMSFSGTRQRNNLYLPQANLIIYQKGRYYSGKTFLIIYLWRLRMLLVTKKIALENFYKFIHFTHWKSTLVNCELRTVLEDF